LNSVSVVRAIVYAMALPDYVDISEIVLYPTMKK